MLLWRTSSTISFLPKISSDNWHRRTWQHVRAAEWSLKSSVCLPDPKIPHPEEGRATNPNRPNARRPLTGMFGRTATTTPSSMYTSASSARCAFTTVPPLIRILVPSPPPQLPAPPSPAAAQNFKRAPKIQSR
jgi:hypothetical protein